MTGQPVQNDFPIHSDYACVSGGGCCGNPECEARYQKLHEQQIIYNIFSWIIILLIARIISFGITYGIQRLRNKKLSAKDNIVYSCSLTVILFALYLVFGFFFL